MTFLLKRSISFLLCFCMLLGMLPVSALTAAATEETLMESLPDSVTSERTSDSPADEPDPVFTQEIQEPSSVEGTESAEEDMPVSDTEEAANPEPPKSDDTLLEDAAEEEVETTEHLEKENVFIHEEGTAEYIESIGNSLDKETENSLLEAYFYRSFFPGISVLSSDFSGKHLTNALEKELYTLLKAKVLRIAEGLETTTGVSIPIPNPSENSGWTAELLGLESLTDASGKVTSQALGTIFAEVGLNPTAVIYAVRGDCPYEMFWFDLSWKNGFSYTSEKDNAGTTVSISNIKYTIKPTVTAAYRESAADNLTVSTQKIGAVNDAIANARNIVSKHAGKRDIDKIYAYRDELCALNSYNYNAANGYEGDYGDPWQIIYMFDGNPTTKVVCEGYAKGFQFLCECTDFDKEDIYAFSVTGAMLSTRTDSGGGHMWNIMHMDDGRNYLVDVTNSDAGSVGNDRYFFAVPLYGDPNAGYYYADNYFIYDADTRNLFSDEELCISDSPYVPPEIVTPSTGNGSCGREIDWELDTDGILHITGTGDMYDFPDLSDVPWKSERDNIRGVLIGDGITHIGSNAFSYCGNLNEITVPASVTSVGSWAFYWSVSLTDIIFLGDAPTFGREIFGRMTVQVYAPCDAEGWEDSLFSAYGSSVSLKKQHPEAEIVSVPAADPTCAAPGNTAGSKCVQCGHMLPPAEDIPCLPHTVVADPAVPATCTSSGLTEGSHCSVCGTVMAAQEVIPPMDHMELVSGQPVYSCTFSVTTAPTAEQEGVLSGACRQCGGTVLVTMPQISERDYSSSIVQESTFTSDGIVRYTWKDTAHGTITFDVTIPRLQYGDANGNCKVDIADVVLLRKYLAYYDYTKQTSSSEVCAGADANGDGTVSIKDVVLLRRYIANYNYDTNISSVILGNNQGIS